MHVRAVAGSGFIDVNIKTGEQTEAANYGKYLWTREWEIVANAGEPKEERLFPPSR